LSHLLLSFSIMTELFHFPFQLSVLHMLVFGSILLKTLFWPFLLEVLCLKSRSCEVCLDRGANYSRSLVLRAW
jgi:hypothetical protein